MSLSTVTPGRIKTGPGLYRYAPLGTALPTVVPIANSYAAIAWTSWVDFGSTDEGLTYSEDIDSDTVTVAESVYPVRTVVTGKAGKVALSLAQIDDLNWKVAMNGGTITSSGTTGTKQGLYVPPLAGSEVRVMIAFQSLADDEIMIFGQCLQTGSIEVKRGSVGSTDKAMLPLEFSCELPADTGNWTTPYKRYTTGAAMNTAP